MDLNESADIFANSSADTVTENDAYDEFMRKAWVMGEYASPIVCKGIPQNDSSLSMEEMLMDRPDESRIYCPFCPEDFGFLFLLKEHIKKVHVNELNSVLRHRSEVLFHPCPICHAKFHVKELLPRHLLSKHQDYVASIGSLFSTSNVSQLQCLFCKHKVLDKHCKLLMVHIEKKHYKLFESYVLSKFSNQALSQEDLTRFDDESMVATQVVTPSLSRKLAMMSTDDDKVIYAKRPILIKPILKTSSPLVTSYEVKWEEVVDEEEDLRPGARRRLRFDLPSPVQGAKDKAKTLAKTTKRGLRWKWFRKFKKGDDWMPLKRSPMKRGSPGRALGTSTPLMSPGTPVQDEHLPYQCALCCLAFTTNGLLVGHVKKVHRSFSLSARYQCGSCQAKFYRNSFLVRHCWRHHFPRCLKSPRKTVPAF